MRGSTAGSCPLPIQVNSSFCIVFSPLRYLKREHHNILEFGRAMQLLMASACRSAALFLIASLLSSIFRCFWTMTSLRVCLSLPASQRLLERERTDIGGHLPLLQLDFVPQVVYFTA
jgi:hypothetical protein